MSKTTAPVKGTEQKKENALSNGVVKNEAKKETAVKTTFSEMTPRQKVSEILKSAVSLAGSNDFKDLKINFTTTNKENVETTATSKKDKKRIADVKLYSLYKKDGKIESTSDLDFEKVKEKAKLALKDLKEKKYSKHVTDFINFCYESVKGQAAEKGFNTAKVADWSLD